MNNKRCINEIIYTILWIVSLVITSNHSILDTGSLFFLVSSAIAKIYLIKPSNKNGENSVKNRQNNHKGNEIAKGILAFVLCFQLFGRTLFMQELRFSFSVISFVEFIVICATIYPIIPGLLIVFEKLSDKVRTQKDGRKGSIKTGFVCGSTVFIIIFLLTLSYYPCTMTNDSFGHWQQATGALAMSDYSPMAFNLLLKGLFFVTGFTTPYVFVLFQVIVFSAIVGDITFFLNRRGLRRLILIIGSIVFSLIPSTYMLQLYLSKNPLTGILCLGMVSCLLQVIVEPKYSLRNPLWYIKTVTLTSGLYLVRENNAVIILPLIAFAIWFLVSNREFGKKILIAVSSVVFVIILITQGVYKLVEYEHVDKSHETVRPLLAPIGSAVQQGLSLPTNVLTVAEKVLSVEEWKKRYDPFNSDPVTWGTPKPQYKEVTLKEAFSTYIMMLRLYPDVVIKDRLDGMDCVWDIRVKMTDMNKCPTELYGDVSFKDVMLPAGMIRNLADKIRSFSSLWMKITKNEEVLDMFIWRNGIYVFLMMVTALFLFQKKKTKLLWAVLPSCFILLTYALVIAWQMYFYTWFFPLSVVMMIIVTIVECGNKNENVDE